MTPSKSQRNFYEILNATSNATIEELKTNYKHLILQCHPDKLQQQQRHQQHQLELNNDDDYDENDNEEFVAITEAWNCLKDPLQRKQYDAELLLNKFHTHNNIYAHITLSEMKKQPITDQYEAEEEEAGEEEEEEECEAKMDDGQLKEKKSNKLEYIYTYDCRCGGQYIVDESAEQYCGTGNNHDTQQQKQQQQTQQENQQRRFKKSDNNGVEHDVHDDDDADQNTQNNKNSPNNTVNKNNDGGGGDGDGDGGSVSVGVASEGVVQDNNTHVDFDGGDDDEGGELIIECSECSLVIILNG